MGHGGRDEMRHEVAEHFLLDSTPKIINSFLPTCVSCQVPKPDKAHVIPNVIVSIDFMTRLQIDVVDMRIRTDGNLKWILNCPDHFTKYVWAFALPTKEAEEVATNLLNLFCQFGPPKILQSDNGARSLPHKWLKIWNIFGRIWWFSMANQDTLSLKVWPSVVMQYCAISSADACTIEKRINGRLV